MRKGPGSNTPVHPGSWGSLMPNEIRGQAWGMRNLVDAAAYLPDADPFKALFTEKVVNNLRAYDEYAERHKPPVGSIFEGQAPEQLGTTIWAIPRPWQNNYLAWALDHAQKQGFSGGTKLRDRIAQFQLRLFVSDADYPREYAAPYTLIVGRKRPDGTIEYYRTLADVFRATYGGPPGKPTQFKGYYGVDARLMLIIGIENGWAGARAAYNYLDPIISREPFLWQGGRPVPDLANRAGWAIAIDTTSPPETSAQGRSR